MDTVSKSKVLLLREFVSAFAQFLKVRLGLHRGPARSCMIFAKNKTISSLHAAPNNGLSEYFVQPIVCAQETNARLNDPHVLQIMYWRFLFAVAHLMQTKIACTKTYIKLLEIF